MSQNTHQRPSDLLNLSQWAADLIGMPYDWWTAFQFDRAVSHLGTYIENRLQETETRKVGDRTEIVHLYTLEDLLGDKQVNSTEASLEKYRQTFGATLINNG